MSMDDAWGGGDPDFDLALPGAASRIIHSLRRRADRTGDGFVSNMTDLFKSQLGKAKTVLARVGEGGDGQRAGGRGGGFMASGGGGVIAGGLRLPGGVSAVVLIPSAAAAAVSWPRGSRLCAGSGPPAGKGTKKVSP